MSIPLSFSTINLPSFPTNCAVIVSDRGGTNPRPAVRAFLQAEAAAMGFTEQGGAVHYVLRFVPGDQPALDGEIDLVSLDGFADLSNLPITHFIAADVAPVPLPTGSYVLVRATGYYGAVQGGG